MKKVFFAWSAWLAGLTGCGVPVVAQVVDTVRMYQLNEIVVSAVSAKKETPVAFQNLSAEQLNRNNTGQSLPYLLAGTPSLTLTSDAGNGVGYINFRIRGTDANRINFTVDGVPVNDSESHGVFWVNMPDFASSTGQVQIQRGAGTSTHGAGAFGATVAMQTQKPALKPYAEVISSAGSFGTFTTTVKGGTGLLHDRFVFDARYSNVQTDGYIDRARADMNSYYASAAYYHRETMLKFQTFGSSEVSYQAWNGVDSAMLATNRRYNSCGAYDDDGVTRFYDNQTDNYRQHHYHLLATRRFGERWDVSATLHYTDGKGYYEDYKEDAKYAAYKLPDYADGAGNVQKRTDLVRRKWLRNDFYGGLLRMSYTANRLQATAGAAVSNYVGDHFGRVMWVKTASLLPQPDFEYYRNRGEKLDFNVYAKASLRLADGFSAYADMQYRGIDYRIGGSDDKAGDNVRVDRTFPFFNPKAGLAFTRGVHSAYASFAVAHREPNRDNFTENGPSAQPTFETLHDWEAGYAYSSPLFGAGVNLYFMDYDNQFVLTGKISEIGEALTSNIKDSHRAGIELTAGVRIASCLRWEGNATLSSNKIRRFTEYVDTYDADWNELPQTENRLGTTDIAFSPDVIANSRFDFELKGFSASLASSYVGRQYLDNTSSLARSLDPHFVSNLRAGYVLHPQFVREMAFDVSVNNLFNEAYETNGWVWSYILDGARRQDTGYFTQAGTNVTARLTLKF
ncbi:MAG: TonB-dependent receptor plug domain-containing protein [Tannerella sp.]|jgi:iron complex outermembrane receptor protein|nr:TonB-dependent receptor plug domain-containing protein [Tannerella sp.]